MVVGKGLSKSGPNLPMALASLSYMGKTERRLGFGLAFEIQRCLRFVEVRSTNDISSAQIRLLGNNGSWT